MDKRVSIQSIELENFTAFEHMACQLSDGVNVFIGENGTGKTHLLKVLYAISSTLTYNQQKQSQATNFRLKLRYLFDDGKSSVSFTRHDAATKNCKISYTVDDFLRTESPDASQPIMIYGESEEGDPLFETDSLFVPAKDMLTHSRFEKDYKQRKYPFDGSLIDVLDVLGVSQLRDHPNHALSIMSKIEVLIGGKVVYSNGSYFIETKDASRGFHVESEGFKKLSVIYRALDTGYLQPNSVLIWDEPEANINPRAIPLVAEILLELARNGVQVIIATHDYFLPQYLNVLSESKDDTRFHALYKTDNGVKCETNSQFSMLEHNSINQMVVDLYHAEIDKVLG